MEDIRVGIIGIGSMGANHAKDFTEGRVPGAKLVAAVDGSADRLSWAKDKLGVDVFETPSEMYAEGKVDAVLIATPHFFHPDIAIEAFNHGKHVLLEKPAGVYTKNVREMNEAAKKSGKVFSMMFNQRTVPAHSKMRDLVKSGELGDLKRVIYITTAWYRPQSYYDAGEWRATWAGEGGGVLLNQCPHQLDVWQWVMGMPKRVRAFMACGKYHDIEVEDDVTAYVEYENGATGVFLASTGEAPGTNRLEISGTRGKIIMEDGGIMFYRNRVDEREYNKTFKGGFGEPELWECRIPLPETGSEHVNISSNWIKAIQNDNVELIAPGEQGINSLMLSNAMMLSAWKDSWVDLPIDDSEFYLELKKRMDSSSFNPEKTFENKTLNTEDSY